MTVKNDIEEVKRLMELRDDTWLKLVYAQDKILRRLGETKAREILDTFGIALVWEDGVLTVKSKAYVEFWKGYEAEQASQRGEI